MAYTATRVIHIAHESWNKMDMQVEHRLSGRGANIDADVIAVGPMTLVDDRSCRIYQR